MSGLKRHIADQAVLRLNRAYLDAGIMDQGVVQERTQGTPQGGPLSPLLANVLLDDVDRENSSDAACASSATPMIVCHEGARKERSDRVARLHER
jgi:retron-type reverse transcriptase